MLRDRDKPYENLENTGITRAYATAVPWALFLFCGRVFFSSFLVVPRCTVGVILPLIFVFSSLAEQHSLSCWFLLCFSFLHSRVEAMEKSLKRDIMREAASGGGRVLLHDEVRALFVWCALSCLLARV